MRFVNLAVDSAVGLFLLFFRQSRRKIQRKSKENGNVRDAAKSPIRAEGDT